MYEIKTKNIGNRTYLFDKVRKKWLNDRPEERVRIQTVDYLISEVKVPIGWILIEHQIKLYNTIKRVDILVKNKNQTNFLMVECKSPSVKITRETINEINIPRIGIYASDIEKCDYYMVTNGKNQLFYIYDPQNANHRFIEQLPLYQ